MSTPARIGLFALLLVALLGAGALAGGLVGPEDRGKDSAAAGHADDDSAAQGNDIQDSGADHADDDSAAQGHSGGGPSGGEAGDHALALESSTHPLTEPAPLAFTVSAAGKPLTKFDLAHEKRMHVVVVREDLTTFQHLHPKQGAGGRFEIPLTLRSPGAYRVFADHTIDGTEYAPSATLTVPGRPQPRPLPEPSTREVLPGGYAVTLSRDGEEVRFDVTQKGQAIETDPYLGAAGHLVGLSVGKLDYIHNHPKGDELAFEVHPEQPGPHRLFLQFSHNGRVHTAAFTVDL